MANRAVQPEQWFAIKTWIVQLEVSNFLFNKKYKKINLKITAKLFSELPTFPQKRVKSEMAVTQSFLFQSLESKVLSFRI